MTNKRAKQILTSYGGQSEKWPVDERSLLQQLIFSNTELKEIQQQELQLDEQLVTMFSSINEPDTQFLQKRILATLADRKITSNPPVNHFFSRLNKSLLNSTKLLLNPSGIVATVMAIMLLTIGLFNFNHTPPTLAENSMKDELLLMAEALDISNEFELFAVLEPELFDDTSDLM